MNWQAIGEINLQGSFVIFRVSIRSNWSLNFYFEQEAEILKDLCDIFSYFSIFVRWIENRWILVIHDSNWRYAKKNNV